MLIWRVADFPIKVEIVNVTSFACLLPHLMHKVMQVLKYLRLDMRMWQIAVFLNCRFCCDIVRDPGGA